ncbi:MAG: cupin, partial [Anaerolinea sp.]|nr:cupin [Anaerolinea sp.]
LGDDVSHASPGTWVAMQPNLPHSVFAETPVVMMLTMLQK